MNATIPEALRIAVTKPVFPGAICDPEFGLSLIEYWWPRISQEFREKLSVTTCRHDAMDLFSDAVDEVA
jgi:hypothetical protein